jgi:hypothetical protein
MGRKSKRKNARRAHPQFYLSAYANLDEDQREMKYLKEFVWERSLIFLLLFGVVAELHVQLLTCDTT